MLSLAEDWYKDAIIYELHIKAFSDANGDGIGDLGGLIDKLDYLQDLGVTAIWLLPFFPSPFRDDGYDISDYRGIHPAYGDLREFRRFVRAAHGRGMRVIIELVVNHTSDQHPWFQRARTAKPGSVFRDFYVWSDTGEKYKDTRIIFTDTEKSNWTWDPVAAAFYWHRFFSHQPDLNFDNPQVVQAVLHTMNFWLDLGVDGFRLDAIPYLREREGTTNENLPETHALIRYLRTALDRRYQGKVLLAEANQWPEDVKDYFGEGQECHMAFHFPLMPRMYMAIAREDRHPITDIMRQTPDIPDSCQWAIFLRNHDELTLEMVTDAERDYLWSTYAADRRARINLGIRRRLAPLMQNDRRKIELMNSLLLSLPGTPIIYYGDELGMGDNVYLGDRNGVRTPMQWTPDRNGGFSRADPASLYLPPIMDAVYGYQAVNVEAQSTSLSSLLNWMKRLIAVRQSRKVFGRGNLTFLYPANRTVIAYLRQHEDTTVLCVANLSRSAQAVELDLSAFVGRVPVELMGQTGFPPISNLPYVVTLQGYSFYWFELTVPTGPARQIVLRPPELVTLVQQGTLLSLFDGRNRRTLEREILPVFLADRRWFGQKDSRNLELSIAAAPVFGPPEGEWCWLLIEARAGKSVVSYAAPVTANWQPGTLVPIVPILANVRRTAREGYLIDAVHDERFVQAVVDAVRGGKAVEGEPGPIAFRPTAACQTLPFPAKPVVHIAALEQSNSSATIEETLIIKFYRRIAPGIHPEVEMGEFLTEQVGFANAPPLLGSVHFVGGDGEETALAVLHGLIRNQGDGWSFTLAYLDRFLEESRLIPATELPLQEDRHVTYRAFVEPLARRTAELHRALYVEKGPAEFIAETVAPAVVESWAEAVAGLAADTFQSLTEAGRELSEESAGVVSGLMAIRDGALGHIRSLGAATGIVISRHHGDYHLGQVLVVQNDVHIVDFEGPPQIPLAERRRKHSVARDVAGMLRSFDYAAWSALDRATSSQPDRRNDLLQAALQWRDEASRCFLETYTKAMGECPLWAVEAATARRILSLFLIEKALLEIRYELANRPSWVPVPLRGLLAMLPS
jgi:maltose alpha-D-glucosyltransferase/alpha-amylase